MDLAEELERQGLGVRVRGTCMGACFFADDIVLLAESDNELQNMLDVVSNYANRWKLRFNPFKANFFRVQPHQSPSLTSTDNISTTTYPIVMKNPPLERSFHCAGNRENSDEKASQIPRVHEKTLAKSGFGAFKAETNCSSAVEQLRSSFFLESIRGGFLRMHFVESTTSCHGNSRRLNSAPRLRRTRSIEGSEPNFEVLPLDVVTLFDAHVPGTDISVRSPLKG